MITIEPEITYCHRYLDEFQHLICPYNSPATWVIRYDCWNYDSYYCDVCKNHILQVRQQLGVTEESFKPHDND